MEEPENSESIICNIKKEECFIHAHLGPKVKSFHLISTYTHRTFNNYSVPKSNQIFYLKKKITMPL